MNIYFLLLDATHILEIIPLIQDFTSNKFTDQILDKRFAEMFTQNNECVGVYEGAQLIWIIGLWYHTRHYPWKSWKQIMCILIHLIALKKLENNYSYL